MYVINSALRMKYVPGKWKVDNVIMLPKPDKPLSLTVQTSKLLVKLLLRILKPVILEHNLYYHMSTSVWVPK